MTDSICSFGLEEHGIHLPASLAAELARGGPISPQGLRSLLELALAEPVSNQALQALIELHEGDRALNGIGSGVWVCGSARTKPGTEYYELGVEVGAALAAAGFAVFTGGGPGAMEAANKGAKQNRGVSVGVGIVLPNEQQFNLELTIKFLCKYFFIRKVLLTKHTEALVVLPGGNGSMDELYEVLTLVQTKTIPPRPIVLVDHEFWKKLDGWSRDTLLARGMISPGDPDLIKVVNTVDEVMGLIMPKHVAS